MLTISGKALGRKKPLFEDWSIPLPPDLERGDSGLTLRDLIARIVRTEVEAFRQRQRDRLSLRVLSQRQIEEAAAKGKVDLGGRDLKQHVDAEEAVEVALQAFEDGLYLAILDGEEQRDLDREVFVKPDSRITFVRLVMLSGG
jgi:hypothetical protein